MEKGRKAKGIKAEKDNERERKDRVEIQQYLERIDDAYQL